MAFLFALGLVYGIAYACVKNVLVLWPLLIPIGSFFNNLQSGGIDLPWAAIAGFVDVMAVMAAAAEPSDASGPDLNLIPGPTAEAGVDCFATRDDDPVCTPCPATRLSAWQTPNNHLAA
jgi:hypothetical protein